LGLQEKSRAQLGAARKTIGQLNADVNAVLEHLDQVRDLDLCLFPQFGGGRNSEELTLGLCVCDCAIG
jgi:hypothetical protein